MKKNKLTLKKVKYKHFLLLKCFFGVVHSVKKEPHKREKKMVDDKKDSWHLSIISENISTENVLLEELEFKNWKNSSIISRKFYIKYKF